MPKIKAKLRNTMSPKFNGIRDKLNKYCTEKIINFIREFRIVKLEGDKYVNITPSSAFIKSLAAEIGLPITNYFLNELQIKMMLKHRF